MAQEGLPQIGWAKGTFPPDSADPGWPCGTPLWGQAVWKRPEISVLVIPPWANLL